MASLSKCSTAHYVMWEGVLMWGRAAAYVGMLMMEYCRFKKKHKSPVRVNSEGYFGCSTRIDHWLVFGRCQWFSLHKNTLWSIWSWKSGVIQLSSFLPLCKIVRQRQNNVSLELEKWCRATVFFFTVMQDLSLIHI